MNEPHMAPWWFPANDHPLDKAIVDVSHPTVDRRPRGHRQRHAGEPARTGRTSTTWHWRADEPMAHLPRVLRRRRLRRSSAARTHGLPWLVAVSQRLAERDQGLACGRCAPARTSSPASRRTSAHYPFEVDRRAHHRPPGRLRAGEPDPSDLPRRSAAPAEPRRPRARPPVVRRRRRGGALERHLAQRGRRDLHGVALDRDARAPAPAATSCAATTTTSRPATRFWQVIVGDPGADQDLRQRRLRPRRDDPAGAAQPGRRGRLLDACCAPGSASSAAATAPPQEFEALAASVSGQDLTSFFDRLAAHPDQAGRDRRQRAGVSGSGRRSTGSARPSTHRRRHPQRLLQRPRPSTSSAAAPTTSRSPSTTRTCTFAGCSPTSARAPACCAPSATGLGDTVALGPLPGLRGGRRDRWRSPASAPSSTTPTTSRRTSPPRGCWSPAPTGLETGDVPSSTVDDSTELSWDVVMRAGRTDPAGCADVPGDAVLARHGRTRSSRSWPPSARRTTAAPSRPGTTLLEVGGLHLLVVRRARGGPVTGRRDVVDPRLHRVHRHPGPRPGPRPPRPLPGRRADRRRVAPRALRGAGGGVRPGLLRSRRGGLHRGRRDAVRRRPQRHHRRGRAAPDAGRARRRHHARAGQQGVADHRRPAGAATAPGPARSCRSTPSTAPSRRACAPAPPRRYAASC